MIAAHGQPSPIRIRPATTQDAATLSAFAARVFDETFAAVNRPEDMAIYLAEAFSVERQHAEIADPAAIVLIADARDGDGRDTLAGYAHLAPSDVPDVVRGPAPLELKRFYVDAPWQGRGLAQALMQAVIDAAAARGARTLWLGVWEHNRRAVAFYRKWDFTPVGSHVFLLGRDPQTDLLMARAIDDGSE